MSPKCIKVILFSVLAGAGLSTQTASAGGLAQTARGIDSKSSSNSSSGSNSDDNDDNDDNDDDDDDSYGLDASGSTWRGGSGSSCYDCEPNIHWDISPAQKELRIAAQDVRDSAGSFRIDASVLFGRGGAYVSADHYFESISAKGANGEMSEDVHINLFQLAPMFRFVNEEVIKADIHLGLAVATSSHFDTLPGAVLGMRILARANKMLALSVEARAMAYQHDIVAYEGAAGAQYSIAWVGYRALKFDVGPVLEGPEVGLRFPF